MRVRLRYFALCLTAFFIASCATPPTGRIVTIDETVDKILWTAEEKTKPIAARRLRATDEKSVHLIRLADSEKPHIHQKHDLMVVMLSGAARLHIGERSIDVLPGDVMEIPRGIVHWAEFIGQTSEVYVIFSPPYNGLDNIPVLPFTPPAP